MYKIKSNAYIQNSISIIKKLEQLQNTNADDEKRYDLLVLLTLGFDTQEKNIQKYIKILMIDILDKWIECRG